MRGRYYRGLFLFDLGVAPIAVEAGSTAIFSKLGRLYYKGSTGSEYKLIATNDFASYFDLSSGSVAIRLSDNLQILSDTTDKLDTIQGIKQTDSPTFANLVIDNGGYLRFKEDTPGAQSVYLTVPTDVTTSYTLTLPAAGPGANNKILEADSSGNLSWINTPASGSNYWSYNTGVLYPVNTSDKVVIGATAASTAPFTVVNSVTGAYPSEAPFAYFGDGTDWYFQVTGLNDGSSTSYVWIGSDANDVYLEANGLLSLDAATTVRLKNSSRNIDLTGNAFVPSHNGVISLGSATYSYATTYTRYLSLAGATTGYALIQAATSTSTYTLTLPAAGPGGDKMLQSNSSGVLSWVDVPSGGTSYWTQTTPILSPTGVGNYNVRVSRQDGTTPGNSPVFTLYRTGASAGAVSGGGWIAGQVDFSINHYDYSGVVGRMEVEMGDGDYSAFRLKTWDSVGGLGTDFVLGENRLQLGSGDTGHQYNGITLWFASSYLYSFNIDIVNTTANTSFYLPRNNASANYLILGDSSSTASTWVSVSSVLDVIGSTKGNLLVRGTSTWAALVDGTSGQVLTTDGSGTLSWATPTNYWSRSGTELSLVNSGDDVLFNSGEIIRFAGTSSNTEIYKSGDDFHIKPNTISSNNVIILNPNSASWYNQYLKIDDMYGDAISVVCDTATKSVYPTLNIIKKYTGTEDGSYNHLGSLRFKLDNGTVNTIGADIYVTSTQAWDASNNGVTVVIKTIATNSNVLSERFSILGTGAIRFNNAYTFPTSDGSANQCLSTNGSGTVSWVSVLTNPMTTAGDIIYGGTSGAATRLAKGTAGQVLTMNSGATAPEWADASGGTSITKGRAVTASGNLVAGDVNTIVYSEEATAITLTIPSGTYSVDDTIYAMANGAGQITIAVGTGQTINSACKTGGQDQMIAIICWDDTPSAEVFKVIGGVE